MKTSNRFNNAISNLYKAFHNDTLNPNDCKQCAVGNILNNKDNWKHFTDIHGSIQLNYIGLVHQNLGRKFNGYTPIELLKIENSFLRSCGYELGKNHCYKPEMNFNKIILFNGLCEVVSLLCQFDGIPNVMDCSALFKYNKHSKGLKFA
ncbi:Na(+)-translocating NADH-quinone reductase subunit F [Winogradskyella sp. PE311]|uniref:Na(+)-translocating NADH-quinone reductase subunit F n=1 Tax=Winogradskyella sp. PE311 TaxID=3366943 RepID=UPI00398151C7